jgi:hypothetical protein
VGAGGVEAPLQYVAVDQHRARQLSVPLPLLEGADVDNQRTRLLLGGQVGGVDAVEPVPGRRDQVVYRPLVHAGTVPRLPQRAVGRG